MLQEERDEGWPIAGEKSGKVGKGEKSAIGGLSPILGEMVVFMQGSAAMEQTPLVRRKLDALWHPLSMDRSCVPEAFFLWRMAIMMRMVARMYDLDF